MVGHRIILDSRMYMVEKQNIHEIDFDLKFSFLDLDAMVSQSSKSKRM